MRYDVQYRLGASGPWTGWLTGTSQTNALFEATRGQTYTFQVQAWDLAGNSSGWVQSGVVALSPVTKYYLFGSQAVAMRRGDVVYYLSGDHLGSTSLTTDQSGAVIAETRYLPYGEERWTDGAQPTDFGFTSQRNDSYMELYDYGARWYDPQLGRFISSDPIIPNPANPQSWNRYSYAVNNPLKYVDPTGHSFRLPCFVCKLKIDVSSWPDSGKKAAGLVVNLTIGGKYDAEQDAIVGPTPEEWVESGLMDVGAPAPLGAVTGKAGRFLQEPLKGKQLPLPGLEKIFGPDSWPDRLAKLPIQTHHILSDKHRTKWSELFDDIIKPYGLELDQPWNKIDISHYQKGGHPEAYHQWVYNQIRDIATIADGNKEKFLELFNERVKKEIKEHPERLFEDYWE